MIIIHVLNTHRSLGYFISDTEGLLHESCFGNVTKSRVASVTERYYLVLSCVGWLILQLKDFQFELFC